MNDTALQGFRVLDLSHALAAPSATKLLADFGAEVIKVEPPRKGDFTRSLTPWVFESFNRSKKSIAVDLKSSEGKDIVRDLARISDVVVQSFRPGVVEEMGLGRDDLSALNPRLIYVSFSGFGQTGPDSARRGVDPILQAETGMALLQGGVLGSLSFVDAAAGLALTGAILASLLKRERTGAVDHIEVNLLDVAMYLQTAPILECSVTGKMLDQTKHASRYPLTGMFQAADGPLFLGLYWDADWEAFCELANTPELRSDSRFATAADRSANVTELRELVNKTLSARPRRHWIDGLEAKGILAGEVRTHTELLAAAQVQANDTVEHLPTSKGELGAYVRGPVRIHGRDRPAARPAPGIGQHTEAILDLLGMSAEKKRDLRKRKVVG